MSDTWLKTSQLLSDFERSIKDDLAHTAVSDLSITSIYILAALYKQDGQRPMDLALAANVPATSLTPILDRIEVAGFIQRGINTKDRRSILISLTKEGKKLKSAIEYAIGRAEVKYGEG